MNVNSIASLLPMAGLGGGAGVLSSVTSGMGAAATGGALSPGNLVGELTAGLSDDASSTNVLSQLASTLGTLTSQCGASGAGASSGVTVPPPTASSPQFRSYSSLQQSQPGGSNSETTAASLIGGVSDDGDDA